MKKTLIIVILLFAASCVSSAITVDKIVKNVEKRYKSLDTFSASMWLISTSAYIGEDTTYKGKLYAKHPNIFRFEYTEPMKQTLVYDGDIMWIYTPNTNQVIKYPVTSVSGDETIWGMYEKSQKDYNFKLLGEVNFKGGATTYKLHVTAKNAASTFQDIYIWVDKDEWVARRLDMIDGEGNKNSYRITNFGFDPSIKSSKFSFTPPKGADVINADEIGK